MANPSDGVCRNDKVLQHHLEWRRRSNAERLLEAFNDLEFDSLGAGLSFAGHILSLKLP